MKGRVSLYFTEHSSVCSFCSSKIHKSKCYSEKKIYVFSLFFFLPILSILFPLFSFPVVGMTNYSKNIPNAFHSLENTLQLLKYKEKWPL